MSKLEELYREREQLNARIAEAELCQHLEAMLGVVEQAAWKALPEEALAGCVVAALEYTDGALTRIAVTRNVDVIDRFEVVKKVLPEEPEDEALPEQPSKRGPRSETVGFAVLFGDGKVIAEKTAKKTWIHALRYMGLERVAGYKGGVVGFPMVGRRKRDNSKKNEE